MHETRRLRVSITAFRYILRARNFIDTRTVYFSSYLIKQNITLLRNEMQPCKSERVELYRFDESNWGTSKPVIESEILSYGKYQESQAIHKIHHSCSTATDFTDDKTWKIVTQALTTTRSQICRKFCEALSAGQSR